MISILIIHLLCSLYVAFRLYRSFFSGYGPFWPTTIIFLIIESFVIIRLAEKYLRWDAPAWLMNFSYAVLGLSIYLFVFFIFFDVLRLFRVPFFSSPLHQTAVGIFAVVLSAVVFAYGFFHARDTRLTSYSIGLDKPLEKPLRIAAVSDIHIGSDMSAPRLEAYVERINALNPDIILVAGDIIDHDLGSFTEEFRRPLRNLRAPLGVYAVLGNHEYYSGPINEVSAAIEDAGMKLMKDERIYFEKEGFYLIGRDSLRHSSSGGLERVPIEKLVLGADSSKPVIIMDHIPKSIEDGLKAGADLQISGHTHAGQFFPVTTIVKFMFPLSYGILKENGFNLLVSSGLGLWGPPVRVGSDSEIVLIEITGAESRI